MRVDDRRRLADRQASLVHALMLGGSSPPGFDAVRLQQCSQSLALKRRRAVSRVWPRLTTSLGERFPELFATYASQCPLPREGGPLADGRFFANWLKKRIALPDEGQREALSVDLRFVLGSGGLRPRRGPCVRIVWLRGARRLVVAWHFFGWHGCKTLWPPN
jgi:hypothetical protein